MKRILFLFLLLSIMAAPFIPAGAVSIAQTRQQDIDDYVKGQMDISKIPGLSIGIVEDGEITYLKAYGTADDRGTPVTPDTPFSVGSVGKSFTALCIRQLVNEGRINYDAPVTDYIPWFTLAEDGDAQKISIKDLLENSSGLSFADGVLSWTYNSKYSIEDVVRRMRSFSAKLPAGSRREFCNLNYIILGLVVEKVSGMPYGQYLSKYVFEPLKMESSYPSLNEAQSARLAQGHSVAYGIVVPNNMPVPTGQVPAGFQYSSARDMAKYAALLLNNGYQDGRSIMKGNELPELSPLFPKPNDADRHYSVYWSNESHHILQFSEVNGYHGHFGASSGFTSVLMINNTRRQGIVVLSNCRDIAAVPDEIMAEDIGFGIAAILDENIIPGRQYVMHPDVEHNIMILLAALFLPFLRLKLVPRFVKAVQKGGWRKRLALVSFTLTDVLLPAAILIGLPVYYDNTIPYFLATSLETAQPLLVAALLLTASGLRKTFLLLRSKMSLAA